MERKTSIIGRSALTGQFKKVTREELERRKQRLAKIISSLQERAIKRQREREKAKKTTITKSDFDAEVAKVFYMLTSTSENVDIQELDARIELLNKLKPLIDASLPEKKPMGINPE